MKLEQYTKAQSGQGIRELTHEFFEYHQNYIQQVGNIYWKETDSSVSSKMSLSSQPRSRMISFVANDYLKGFNIWLSIRKFLHSVGLILMIYR